MDTIVFFGDSITAGQSSEGNPLGSGFVSMIAERYAQSQNIIQNSGINGHTVQDLLQRYERDVIAYNPQLILIKIGINDAYNDHLVGNQASRIQQFESDYLKLISNIRTELPQTSILLISPYYISDSSDDPLYQRMNEYGQIVFKLGRKFKIPVLNSQDIFDDAVKNKPARDWAQDSIHPEREGHELLARHIYKFIEDNR